MGRDMLVRWILSLYEGCNVIRLTVLYNLAPDRDEDEFMAWRLGPMQEQNATMPGVIRTDFARVDERYPRHLAPPYRFMTTADWKDRESFEASFYDPANLRQLEEDMNGIGDHLLFVSEVLAETKNE